MYIIKLNAHILHGNDYLKFYLKHEPPGHQPRTGTYRAGEGRISTKPWVHCEFTVSSLWIHVDDLLWIGNAPRASTNVDWMFLILEHDVNGIWFLYSSNNYFYMYHLLL